MPSGLPARRTPLLLGVDLCVAVGAFGLSSLHASADGCGCPSTTAVRTRETQVTDERNSQSHPPTDAQQIALHVEVVLCLHMQPEPSRRPEVPSQSERGVGRDGAVALPASQRKQIRHWRLTPMLYCPARSPRRRSRRCGWHAQIVDAGRGVEHSRAADGWKPRGRRFSPSALSPDVRAQHGRSWVLARVDPQLAQRPPIDGFDASAPPHGRPVTSTRNRRARRIEEPHILDMHVCRPRRRRRLISVHICTERCPHRSAVPFGALVKVPHARPVVRCAGTQLPRDE